jgi:protein-tyrosine phosphatase
MAFLLRRLRPPLSFPPPQSLVIHPDTPNGSAGIDPRRILPLEGGVNFRDLGGYPTRDGRRVRWGRIYRSGSFYRLTQADMDAIAKLGIKLVCDLRSTQELRTTPERLDGIAYEHIPIESEVSVSARLRALMFDRRQLVDLMIKAYTELMIAKSAHVFQRVFERAANADNLPMLIRCTAGKDRTGITVALLLLALGVDEETVIADYSLSNLYFQDFQVFAQAAVKPLGVVGISLADLQPILVADPETLRRSIAYLRNEYGSLESYLRDQAHVTDAMLTQLQAQLLET